MFPNALFLANAGKDLASGLLKLLSSVVIDFRWQVQTLDTELKLTRGGTW